MTTTIRILDGDDEITVTTLDDLIAHNPEMPIEEVEAIAALLPGESTHIGGGAAPIFTVVAL